MKAVSWDRSFVEPVEILGRPDQSRGQTAKRVRQGGSLGHGGQWHFRQPDAEHDGRNDRNDDPQVPGDAGTSPRGEHRQEHAADAGKNAPPRHLRVAHPVQGENKQRRGHQVGNLNEVNHALPPSRVLNILSIRSVIRKPLMMFVIEANKAMAPMTRMCVG